jgi:hypothetical protein
LHTIETATREDGLTVSSGVWAGVWVLARYYPLLSVIIRCHPLQGRC